MADSTATHRALAIPELLRSFFFALPDTRDNSHTALVCRTWSDIALDVLWYEVNDICILFNRLVPLTKSTTGSQPRQEFARCPEPQDWIDFGKYSHRVRKLKVGGTAILPAPSFFDDIGRSRVQHKILPNLWSLRWFVEPRHSVTFLHLGIRDLAVWMDTYDPNQMRFFMRNARFFSPNVVTLEITTGYAEDSDPHLVGSIVAELSIWFAQLHDLRSLTLPRYWMTTPVFKVLSQHSHFTRAEFEYGPQSGYGNPLDTMEFRPLLNSESSPDVVAPSLTSLSQSAPFSEMTQFISSWRGSIHLQELTIASQILEPPDAFRSALNVITVHCPQLTWLGLTCLTTPYRHHPRPSSHSRITLDTLLQLHKLKHLISFEITHTLPLALSNEDFLILIKEWPKMETLRLGYNPYPLASEVIQIAEAPLLPAPVDAADASLQVTPKYPIMGLWQSFKSLRKYCPELKEIYIFGVDDFTVQGDQAELTVDELPPLPFPNLTSLSFGTSSITSKKVAVALALSQYLLPNVTLISSATWGGDQDSPYLIYLNLKSLFPLRNELGSSLQKLIDEADPSPAHPHWVSQDISVDEPIGANGVVDDDAYSEIDRRRKVLEEIASLLPALSEARQDERDKAKRRYNQCHDRV
ncbi:hypothetical protein BDN72DRAFT_905209 [Pluteus cervinus]|uniref:Uncharacterized protein n=1 Tax=Pluteus cervinus TaxID=181527 RepID=A0ACD3A4F2_9AGAR|nr:hypothetical protein BDN72DRAFT_905209 [Pluteus cervinus]